MELDFTGLNAIGYSGPLDERLTCDSTSSPPDSKNASTGLYGGLAGLQWEADRRNQEIERNLETYGTYQNNIKISGTLQAEILKGARNGESIYSLHIFQARTISRKTRRNKSKYDCEKKMKKSW